MARTQGKPIPHTQDVKPPSWEPEPLHMPVYLPAPPARPAPQDEGDEPKSRVIIIDLA